MSKLPSILPAALAAIVASGCTVQPIQSARPAAPESVLFNASKVVDVRAAPEHGEPTKEEFCDLIGRFAHSTAVLRDAEVPKRAMLKRIEHNPPISDFLRMTVEIVYNKPNAAPEIEQLACTHACLEALDEESGTP
jgi:hypothetical protein